jgi:hypothetical protein
VDALALELTLESGERLRLTGRAVRRLPIVRGVGPRALRVELLALALGGATVPAGWCELGGV